MVRRRLVSSRQIAQSEIAAGRVTVDGAPADKAARLVDPAQDVRLLGPAPPYVSRAGLKLEAALDTFAIEVEGLRCLDAGASTGGFTDCLLQRGAGTVIAVDVGTNQLHEKIRADDRVEVHEQTDIRRITPSSLGGAIDLVVVDLSFISLRLVLPALDDLADGATIVALVKPQFEAGRNEASKGRGVIRDPAIWRRVLGEVVAAAAESGRCACQAAVSPISGSAGNVEFVVRLERGDNTMTGVDELLDRVVAEAEARAL